MSDTRDQLNHQLIDSVTNCLRHTDLPALQASMREKGFAVLRGLFRDELLRQLQDECAKLIDMHGVERNLHMKETAYTPRRMVNVKRDRINEYGLLIPRIYHDPMVRRLFEIITGERFTTCPYTPEEYIINCLYRVADTHGWHWDDYKYGVVFAVETPPAESGGYVQVVPNTFWNKDKPSVEAALFSGPAYAFRLEPGDAYILRTDTGMHRVSPIQEGTSRVVVNMVWAAMDELDKPTSHETMETLFA